MTGRRAELEGLHTVPAEEGDLLVPVSDTLLPVVVCRPKTLLVDVEVLSHTEPVHSPTVRAVVGKLALVSVGLRHQGQLVVPDL